MIPQVPELNAAKASQSPRTCEAVSDAWLHLSHSEVFTTPSLNKCPFKWQCPVDSPVSILSWYLLKLSSSPALLAEGLLRKSLACLCPWMDCQYSVCFLFVHPLITSLAILVDMPRAGSGPINGHEEPYLASWSAISFPSIPICPGTYISWTLLCSASLIRDWWQSQTNLELIWKLLTP
jgi:hypothetical protein